MPGDDKFQFLIGRLKTRRVIFAKGFVNEFQFLIGRLKTIVSAISITP